MSRSPPSECPARVGWPVLEPLASQLEELVVKNCHATGDILAQIIRATEDLPSPWSAWRAWSAWRPRVHGDTLCGGGRDRLSTLAVCRVPVSTDLRRLDLAMNCMTRGKYCGVTDMGHPMYEEVQAAIIALGLLLRESALWATGLTGEACERAEPHAAARRSAVAGKVIQKNLYFRNLSLSKNNLDAAKLQACLTAV